MASAGAPESQSYAKDEKSPPLHLEKAQEEPHHGHISRKLILTTLWVVRLVRVRIFVSFPLQSMPSNVCLTKLQRLLHRRCPRPDVFRSEIQRGRESQLRYRSRVNLSRCWILRRYIGSLHL